MNAITVKYWVCHAAVWVRVRTSLRVRRNKLYLGYTRSRYARNWLSSKNTMYSRYESHVNHATRVNMSSYSVQALREKLSRLTNSQESIETLSLWIIHHKQNAASTVSIWFEDLCTCKCFVVSAMYTLHVRSLMYSQCSLKH